MKCGGALYTGETRSRPQRVLAGLTLAWKAGEVRPTHTTKPRPPRTWRSWIDPFEQVWPQINGWLEDEPDQTGVELLARLQQTHPGRFPDGQLRNPSAPAPRWPHGVFSAVKRNARGYRSIGNFTAMLSFIDAELTPPATH